MSFFLPPGARGSFESFVALTILAGLALAHGYSLTDCDLLLSLDADVGAVIVAFHAVGIAANVFLLLAFLVKAGGGNRCMRCIVSSVLVLWAAVHPVLAAGFAVFGYRSFFRGSFGMVEMAREREQAVAKMLETKSDSSALAFPLAALNSRSIDNHADVISGASSLFVATALLACVAVVLVQLDKALGVEKGVEEEAAKEKETKTGKIFMA